MEANYLPVAIAFGLPVTNATRVPVPNAIGLLVRLLRYTYYEGVGIVIPNMVGLPVTECAGLPS